MLENYRFRLNIWRHIDKEAVFALLILLPYVENNLLQDFLDIQINSTSYIKAIVFIMIALCAVFMVICVLLRRFTITDHGLILFGFVFAGFLSLIVIAHDFATSLCVWLWLCVPMVLSILSVSVCCNWQLNITKVLKYMIQYFTTYLFVVLAYYVVFKRLFIDSSVRMSPRGGGAVIFGYTIAVVFALCIYLKESFSSKVYYALLILLSIGALGTATRGAVWPIAGCWVINLLFSKSSYKKTIAIAALVPLSVILFSAVLNSSVEFIGWQRLFNPYSFRRMSTSSSIFSFFSELPLYSKLFGLGLGNFFPYQHWFLSIDDVEQNMFEYNGRTFMVQPHNSFLYTLVETGVLGIAFFAVFFILVVFCIMKNGKEKRDHALLKKLIVVGVVLVVNCLDSVFYVQPGVAFVYWLILLLLVEEKIQRNMIEGYVKASIRIY